MQYAGRGADFTTMADSAPLHGIDVSEWQRLIDWPQLADVIDFAVARFSYGAQHLDPFFGRNWDGIRSIGKARAGYQYVLAAEDPRLQARQFAKGMNLLADDMDPWVDFEEAAGVSADQAADFLGEYCDELDQETGRVATMYTGFYFWRGLGARFSDASWAAHPLAIAAYQTAAPKVPAPWATYSYWQHSSAGRVPGIAGLVDLDISVVPLLTHVSANPEDHPLSHLNAPVVATLQHPDNDDAYWQVAADGGIFAYGGAESFVHDFVPTAPITSACLGRGAVGMRLSAADGSIYNTGDRVPMHGHAPDPSV